MEKKINNFKDLDKVIKDPQVLSMKNYKDMDISKLSQEDFITYIFSKMMMETINLVDMSVSNDRVWKRVKFEIMKIFHDNYKEIEERK